VTELAAGGEARARKFGTNAASEKEANAFRIIQLDENSLALIVGENRVADFATRITW